MEEKSEREGPHKFFGKGPLMKFAKGRIFEMRLRLIASALSRRCRLIADATGGLKYRDGRGDHGSS